MTEPLDGDLVTEGQPITAEDIRRAMETLSAANLLGPRVGSCHTARGGYFFIDHEGNVIYTDGHGGMTVQSKKMAVD